jgi:5-methyltetrahydrofolate--homocysteine methyltransferase
VLCYIFLSLNAWEKEALSFPRGNESRYTFHLFFSRFLSINNEFTLSAEHLMSISPQRAGRGFLQTLEERKILFFDGGIGTMLQARGLPPGMTPEFFCLENPGILHSIHADYARAGADVLTTNTFGGNSFKLPDGLDVFAFNRDMAELAREAADKSGRRVFVAGSIGPSGKFLHPLGEIGFAEMLQAYMEQIRGLAAGGADLLQVETQIDLAEARVIVVAARRVCDLPISVSMTYEDGMTLTGSSPEVCAATLANLGVDIIATNCSAGPEQMRVIAERLVKVSPKPVLAQPNAGLPELVEGRTIFPLGPGSFADLTASFISLGLRLVGGCCGTTPEHIAALRTAVERIDFVSKEPVYSGASITVTSRSRLVRVGAGSHFCLIGERINPTGKKQLSAELAAGELGQALRYAAEQIDAGAQLLDVNVGAPMVDETVLLPSLASQLSIRFHTPLSLDSSNVQAIEAALEQCPASALINSINGEPGRLERLGPLCREFGSPFILLPLEGRNLPVRAGERIRIIETLLKKMEELKVPRELALVDCLVLAVSSKPEAAAECLKFIRYCAEILKLPTVAGLSNISFGLPARELLNAHFLSMAAGAGLSACIANPASGRISEAVAVSNLFLEQDRDAAFFISQYTDWSAGEQGGGGKSSLSGSGRKGGETSSPGKELTLEQAVIAGLREDALPLVEKALAENIEPSVIVNECLIPAITEVGAKYERKEYFLPQLLRSAETMQTAFARLRPLLKKDMRAVSGCKVIMATVEGDIHDIGKNIVNLMLGNHGFEVIDLGKDVKAHDIVEAAVVEGADLIGLSALMTTTMIRMQDTLDLLKKRNLEHIKVMVGGAVLTPAFARSIGAHGFAGDAVEAVRVAKNLTGMNQSSARERAGHKEL